MHFIYHLFLLIIHFTIFGHCQRGGGGGGVHVGSFRLACKTEECRENHGWSMSRFLWIVGLPLLTILCGGIKYCCQANRSESTHQNSTSINMSNRQNNQEEIDNINPFQSGVWSSRYFQYDEWHGPHLISLTFDSQSKKVMGSGLDDISSFTIDGTYSIKHNRIMLVKKYQPGTDNPSKKVKHKVILGLKWKTHSRQYEGEYLVSSGYNRGKFELKFERMQNDVCESV